jgi:hypothetical protein
MNLASVAFLLVIASPFLVVLFLYLGQLRHPSGDRGQRELR